MARTLVTILVVLLALVYGATVVAELGARYAAILVALNGGN